MCTPYAGGCCTSDLRPPFLLQAAPGPSGAWTEAIAISTGTAPDAAPPGYSQATIGLVVVSEADREAFEADWAGRLRVDAGKKAEPVAGTKYDSRASYDARTRMHTELIIVQSAKGAAAVFYGGLDGTYQANRPHFVDFLKRLRLPD